MLLMRNKNYNTLFGCLIVFYISFSWGVLLGEDMAWRSQLISPLADGEQAVIDFGDGEEMGDDDILYKDLKQWIYGIGCSRMDECKGELVGPPRRLLSQDLNLKPDRFESRLIEVIGSISD